MAEITLAASRRDITGTRPVRRLRAQGKIPAVVYGLGDAVPVTVDWKELRASLVTEQGLNAVIHLELDGERTPTLVKDLQRHSVRRDVLHVDFIRVDLDKPVDVEVPVVLEGEAELVAREGGVVDHVLTQLLITAKPADIPSQLLLDISPLEIGDALRVSDLTLPPGVTTQVEPEEAVVTGHYAAVEEEPEAEVVEGEEVEAAEGEAPEAGADEAEGGSAEGGDEG